MTQNILWQTLFSNEAPPYTEYGKVFIRMVCQELKHLNSSDEKIEKYASGFYLQEYGFHRIDLPFYC